MVVAAGALDEELSLHCQSFQGAIFVDGRHLLDEFLLDFASAV